MNDLAMLLRAMIVNGLLLAAAWRATRRWIDTLLLWFAAQYILVAVAGLVGLLTGPVLAAGGILVGLVMCAIRREGEAPAEPKLLNNEGHGSAGASPSHRVVLAFIFGFAAAFVWFVRYYPPFATDTLTYHFPAAVQWLQGGRIGLYDTWFFNPANTYSPLAGSMFAAWWMAVTGNDTLARYMALPAWLMVFAGLWVIVRSVGARPLAAVLLAAAAVLSRPFIQHLPLAKDDLYVAAFFLAAVAALDPRRLRDSFAPWRLGLSVGLLLATKYTALLSAVLLLLAIDAPWRAGWRWKRWGVTAVCVALMAGPWFVRNALLTGNPVFPVRIFGLPGLFQACRAPELASGTGMWNVLTNGLYAIPPALLISLAALWLWNLRKLQWRDPLRRLVLLGPPVGIGLFLLTAPYAEVRFILPSLALLFLAVGTNRLFAFVIFVIALATSFERANWGFTVQFAAAGAACLFLGLLPIWRRRRWIIGGVAALIALLAWPGYLATYREAVEPGWRQTYGELADLWAFVRNELPPDARLAYVNTHLTYPLYGFDLQRRVAYAPSSAQVHYPHDLLPLGKLAGEQINRAVEEARRTSGDRAAWFDNLRRLGITHILLAAGESDPPERAWIAADPARFQPLLVNAAGAVYTVRPGE